MDSVIFLSAFSLPLAADSAIQSAMDSREALVGLNMIEHVGPVRVRQLLEHFGDASAILRASKQQLLQVGGIGEETAEAIANWEQSVDLSGELKRIQEFGCHILTQTDKDYPELLRQIYDPPIVLYVNGRLTVKDKNAVAMVGSRQTTNYGLEIARKLAYQLAYLGVTVVSGGARGIDTAKLRASSVRSGASKIKIDAEPCTGQNQTVQPNKSGLCWRATRRGITGSKATK